MPGATLTVTGSAINGNVGSCVGGGIVTSNANLTVVNSRISDNEVIGGFFCGSGGGISYDGAGTVTVTKSVISGNRAPFFGGGMVLSGNATVSVTDSTISGNSANLGGGISVSVFGAPMVTLTVTNSTISDNQANDGGGGIFNRGNFTVTNSTFSNNHAFQGGGDGVYNAGNFTVTNSTFSNNLNTILNDAGSMQISDTVLSGAGAGPTIVHLGGTVTSLGYNLASDNGGGFLAGPGDQINTDPLLGPLQDNGGPTFTHALLPGSPAINAGDPNFTPPPLYDQRGPHYFRVVNGRIDIGSFESRPRPTPHPRP